MNRAYETDQAFDPEHKKTQWERFEHYVRHLNQTDPERVSYKVIYAARHGEGHHNAKAAAVGREEWEVCAILSQGLKSQHLKYRCHF